MLPIVAGVLTSIAFASSVLTSTRASRIAGPVPSVAGVMVVGLAILLPVALITTPLPADRAITPTTFVLATLAGAANIGGLLLIYAGLRIGAVAIVSTIASTEGAIAAVISVVAGQSLAAGSGLALALIAFGVALAAGGRGEAVEGGVPIRRGAALRSAALAGLAAAVFGLGLFLTGQVSGLLPAPWVLLPGRIVGVLAVAIPLALTGRVRIPAAGLPFVLATGVTEVAGFWLYTIGAQLDIALTAVLSSMFAPVAAVLAFVLFRERLARVQVLGIALVVIGVAALGWLSA